MKKKKALAVVSLGVMGISLFLFSTSWALAQASIEGWDKAKFGMSPKELRKAYEAQERKYSRETKKKDFWQKRKEEFRVSGYLDGSGMIKFTEEFARPYRFCTSAIRILGRESQIYFGFMDNKLFRIDISGGFEKEERDEITEAEKDQFEAVYEKGNQFYAKLRALTDFFIDKYGESPYVFRKDDRSWHFEWKDSIGNSLDFCVSGEYVRRGRLLYFFPIYTITYAEKELAEAWDLRRQEMLLEARKKEGERLKEERKKLLEKKEVEKF